MRLVLIFFLCILLPFQALAKSTDWINQDSVSARLITATEATGSGSVIQAGIEIKLAPEWHTYWRAPGQAGLPPQLDISRSVTEDANIASVTIRYPAPTRYTAYNLETIGYRDHVVFPLDMTLRHAGAAHMDMGLDLLVCSSICVPKHFDLNLVLPAGEAVASAEAALIQDARDHMPTDAEKSGLLLQSIHNDGSSLSFVITSRDVLSAPDVFIENENPIGFSAPTVTIDPNGHRATLTVKPVDTLPADNHLAGIPMTVTFVNDEQSTEIKITTPAVNMAQDIAVPAPAVPFAVALLFALIGGVILNLMPCVLPVLSLKILSVISHGGGTAQQVRHSFFMTALGILFSFMLLAVTTIVLKHLGMSLGWGVQFQQPFFLMFLVLLLTFFAANLWDLLDIQLPRFLADRLDTSYHPKLAGDFATGAFATLLATPCSAPFLGTAVGFALASGAPEILAIFAALGCGMALPYLAVALFPRVATRLPRPGAWMITLRFVLGIALGLTALWLVWVLAAQITVENAALFGVLMAGLIVLLALRKRGMKRGLILFGIIECCLMAFLLGLNGAMQTKPDAQIDRLWLPYSQIALAADIAEGKTVFLDVTADWCLTCKANMKFTLSRVEIKNRIFHTDIIAMQADWTNPNPAIADLLHKYGRYGIPFNIVYGPGAPDGITLPELLTPTLVLDALDRASGQKQEKK